MGLMNLKHCLPFGMGCSFSTPILEMPLEQTQAWAQLKLNDDWLEVNWEVPVPLQFNELPVINNTCGDRVSFSTPQYENGKLVQKLINSDTQMKSHPYDCTLQFRQPGFENSAQKVKTIS